MKVTWRQLEIGKLEISETSFYNFSFRWKLPAVIKEVYIHSIGSLAGEILLQLLLSWIFTILGSDAIQQFVFMDTILNSDTNQNAVIIINNNHLRCKLLFHRKRKIFTFISSLYGLEILETQKYFDSKKK